MGDFPQASFTFHIIDFALPTPAKVPNGNFPKRPNQNARSMRGSDLLYPDFLVLYSVKQSAVACFDQMPESVIFAGFSPNWLPVRRLIWTNTCILGTFAFLKHTTCNRTPDYPSILYI